MEEQQALLDTQLDGAGDHMDVVDHMAAAVGSAVAMAAGTTDVMEGGHAMAGGETTETSDAVRASNGSFEAGRVQSRLDGWLL